LQTIQLAKAVSALLVPFIGGFKTGKYMAFENQPNPEINEQLHRAMKFSCRLQAVESDGRALIWSARTCPRFGTGRHVSQWESGDLSPHSK
jgi:hypothetical protein